MTNLQIELEEKLKKLLTDRDEHMDQLKKVRDAVLEGDSRKNIWITTMVNDIEKLDTYIRQHQNRITSIKQRQKLSKNKINSKEDTKRKILLGAMVEKLLARGELDKKFIADKLDVFLVRDSDKALFVELFKNN